MDTKNPFDRTFKKVHDSPVLYDALSTEDKYLYVRRCIAAGEYKRDENIGIDEIFVRGMRAAPWHPTYALHRIWLSETDITNTAKEVHGTGRAKFFLEAYGVELSLPFIADEIWFSAYREPTYSPEDEATTKEIKKLLQHRGAERISALITDEKAGAAFVDVFGIKATSYLPSRLAKQIKGKLLEDSLGL
jgi:hypothetical protein